MYPNHKPGEIIQVIQAADSAAVIDTDTCEIIPPYMFMATLPYSDYSYLETFLSMNQKVCTSVRANSYRYFSGVTWIIQYDDLKTGTPKHGNDEWVLNKFHQKLAEHYGTAILSAKVRSPKDKIA